MALLPQTDRVRAFPSWRICAAFWWQLQNGTRGQSFVDDTLKKEAVIIENQKFHPQIEKYHPALFLQQVYREPRMVWIQNLSDGREALEN